MTGHYSCFPPCSVIQLMAPHMHTQPLIFSNTNNVTLPSPTHLPLPLWKKLVYAVGAIPYPMCNTVVGFYLNIFLLEVAIVSCLATSLSTCETRKIILLVCAVTVVIRTHYCHMTQVEYFH